MHLARDTKANYWSLAGTYVPLDEESYLFHLRKQIEMEADVVRRNRIINIPLQNKALFASMDVLIGELIKLADIYEVDWRRPLLNLEHLTPSPDRS